MTYFDAIPRPLAEEILFTVRCSALVRAYPHLARNGLEGIFHENILTRTLNAIDLGFYDLIDLSIINQKKVVVLERILNKPVGYAFVDKLCKVKLDIDCALIACAFTKRNDVMREFLNNYSTSKESMHILLHNCIKVDNRDGIDIIVSMNRSMEPTFRIYNRVILTAIKLEKLNIVRHYSSKARVDNTCKSSLLFQMISKANLEMLSLLRELTEITPNLLLCRSARYVSVEMTKYALREGATSFDEALKELENTKSITMSSTKKMDRVEKILLRAMK